MSQYQYTIDAPKSYIWGWYNVSIYLARNHLSRLYTRHPSCLFCLQVAYLLAGVDDKSLVI